MSGKTTKVINKIIFKRMNDWLDSIDDDGLRLEMKKDIIVTGGCITSMLLGEDVNDYDVYFKRKETLVKVAIYYLEKFKLTHSVGEAFVDVLKDTRGEDRVRLLIKDIGTLGRDDDSDTDPELLDEAQQEYENDPDKDPYDPVFLSSNAISLRGKIQIILRFHGGPEQIHDNFDFVHCTNYWTFKDHLVTNEDALLATMSRTLVYRGSRYPICSIFRSRKFIMRGWRINAGQYLKMALQIRDLDLYDIRVLEEQLTGVDAAYFSDLISKMETRANDGGLDSSYIISVINKVFD